MTQSIATNNPYANDPAWKQVQIKTELHEGRLYKHITYERRYNRYKKFTQALGITILTSGIALASKKTIGLWKAALGNRKTVNILVEQPDETPRPLSQQDTLFPEESVQLEPSLPLPFEAVITSEAELTTTLRNDLFKYHPATKEAKYVRIQLYQQTKKLWASLDQDATQMMIEGTVRVKPAPLSLENRVYHKTVVEVTDIDSFDMAEQYTKEGLKPAVLNLASAYCPGGGIEYGYGTQEESLCRRSNLQQALLAAEDKRFYPIPEDGHLIYSPSVQVFRKSEPIVGSKSTDGWDLTEPWQVGVITCAAYNLAHTVHPKDDYVENTKAKIKSILRIAIEEDHDSVILGAFGCGAFHNDPKTIASYFRDLLAEEEFAGRFKKVGFAILTFGNPQSYTFKTFKTRFVT